MTAATVVAAVPTASNPSSTSNRTKEPNTSGKKANHHLIPSMTQSTIYKRHQARVLKNMERRDDPRPAVVRVLSGLPGFRIFIPPYDQLKQQQQPPLSASLSRSPSPTASSFATDETSTVLTGFVKDTDTSKITYASDSSNREESSTSSTIRPLHVMLAAGIAGATAEAFFGGNTANRVQGHPSPFRVAAANNSKAKTTSAVPFVQGQGSTSMFKFHTAHHNMANNHHSTSTTGLQLGSIGANKTQLYAGATTASVLFGTKAFVTRCLETSAQDTDHTNNNNPLSLTSLIASATAGAMVAAVNVIHQSSASGTQTRILRMPTSLPLTQNYGTLPRHVMGATIYFSSYEAMKSFLVINQQPDKKKTPPITAVAISGAMAGAMYQSVLLSQHNNGTVVRLVPTVLRVAPAHALLFVAYEWVQGSL